MRDLDEMLENMKDNEQNQDFEGMNDLERRRIYQKTMQKIETMQEEEEEEGTTMERENYPKKQNKKSYFSRQITKAAAAICIIALAGGTAFAGWKLHDGIKTHYHINDKKTEQKVEKMVSTIDQSVTSGGITVRVCQVIGDENGFYAVLEAKNAPQISEELEFQKTNVSSPQIPETQSVEWDSPKMGAVDEKDRITTFTLRISTQNMKGKQINLSLQNLGYRNAKNKFVTKVKGKWDFSWKLAYQDESKKIKVAKNITLRDTKATWDNMVISPLSVTVNYTQKTQGKREFSEKEWEKFDGKDRIVVQLKDGTRIDSRFDLLNDGVGEANGDQKTMYFDRVIALSDIQSIRFANQTYSFRKSNLEKREKYTSKAANCTIELPKKLHDVIAIRENANAYNHDLKCKEKNAIFYGKKDGCKIVLFAIHRLKGMYSEAELKEKSPFMNYIGYRGGYTYTILYGEAASTKEMKAFSNIMNRYVANVLPYFEYLK